MFSVPGLGRSKLKKLIRQFVFMILVLQVVVDNELVDSSSPLPMSTTYEWPAVEWACRPLLLGAGFDVDSVNNNNINIKGNGRRPNGGFQNSNRDKYTIDDELYVLQEKTRELCLKIRGGRLGGGGSDRKKETTTTAVLDRDTTGSDSYSKNETGFIRGTTVIDKSISDDGETVTTLSLSSSEEEEIESSTIETETSITIETSDSSELPSTPPPAKKQKVFDSRQPPEDVLKAYSFSFYQEGDGSESDPDRIPRKYLKVQNDKRDAARKAMEATLQWRKQNDIDTILARPHPKFDVCNKVFPHYFCGRDESNHVVLVQRPGLINIPMGHANGLSGEDLLHHYVYEMEYLWKVIETDPDATMTSVIDLTGLNMSVLRRAELVNVAKLFVSTMDAHFPARSHRTLLVNSPKWFGAIYKLISPLLRESTKQKITILSKGKKQDEVLQNLLPNCPIPTGKNKFDEMPPSEMETEMRDFCIARLNDSQVEMQELAVA
mmetsp:Transcript_11335/g.26983  ORF Transcript_11335/g.26983 Transcript_11335/m.26983 type:complete len:492 (+) Transcript_11335:652-2127(+)